MSAKDHEHRLSPDGFHTRITEVHGRGAVNFLAGHLVLMHGATGLQRRSWNDLIQLHSSLHPEDQMPIPPTPPQLPNAENRHYAAALLRTLPSRASRELTIGEIKLASGETVAIIGAGELNDWFEGLAIRLEAGANL